MLSPRAIISVFGTYFFYVVPLLHLSLDHWLQYIPPPNDWREAVNDFASLQAWGLFVYLIAISLKWRDPTLRILKAHRFSRISTILIGIGVITWFFVALSFGGPVAYIHSLIEETADLTGYGSVLILAESWPSIIMTLVLIHNRNKLKNAPNTLVVIFVAFIILQFLVGGLRGSRALTVWPLLIVLVLCHLIVRRFTFKSLVIIGAAIFGFSWIYSIYKNAGSNIFGLFSGTTTVTQLADDTGRDIAMMMTEDFGRTAIQSLVLYHINSGSELTKGESYLGAFYKFLPDSLNIFGLRDKTMIATELFYGQPSTSLGGFHSSRILGLGGESMINFGILGIPIIFCLFALFVRRAEALFHQVKENSSALGSALIAATLPSLSILILISDFDNVILFSLKYALPIAGIAWVSSYTLRGNSFSNNARSSSS